MILTELIAFSVLILAIVLFRGRFRKRMLIIVGGVLLLIIAGGTFLFIIFIKSLRGPKITVTSSEISSNRDLANGIDIEKVKVDSIGAEGYPVKYTTFYTTSCNRPMGHSAETLKKIEFYKPGKYSWDEDTVAIRYIHNGLTRERLDPLDETWWLKKFGEHRICPIKFEPKQWYFISIGNPQVTGIFFYIDENGEEKQYYLPSGVCPI